MCPILNLEILQTMRFIKTLVILFTLISINACSDDKTPAIELIDNFITEQAVDKTATDWKLNLKKPPQATFSEDSTYYWDLETNKGKLSIQLMPKVAPMHVSSTIYLTHLGFYDGIIFHRIIPGFMAQGGDPLGLGSGSPGYKYAGEFDDNVKHDKPGILSMANAGPNTDGSQFFITFKETPHLNGKHTVFGEVVAGMETLKELEKFGSAPYGKTTEKLEIVKATIRVE